MKDIPGYEGLYQAGEDGKIYSVERWVSHSKSGRQFVPGAQRVLSLHETGYLVVRLSCNGVARTHRVHRLIAKAFIENPSCEVFVNHKNGVKTDNAVTNLEWCSPKENTNHAISTGLFSVSGVSNPSAKLSKSDILNMAELVESGEKLKDIAIAFGVNRNTVSKALDREFGFSWRQHQKQQHSKPIATISNVSLHK